ncbi:MAG: alkaline phosphatase family protein [Clostridia bacterium]|nr:alkaline phosphatase family protein [Clostridia bacterium]
MENSKVNEEKLRNYLKEREKIDVDIVELIRAIAIHNGASFRKTKDIQSVIDILPNKKHTLFVILDGFGYYKLQELAENSILKQHLKMKIRTVNPTSTACVLTSVLSASYPNSHGIYGWWDYNVKYDLSYMPLLLKQRKTGEDVESLGIKPTDIFNFSPVLDKFNRKIHIFENRDIINSSYSKLISKKADRYGFYSVKDAFSSVSRRLKETTQSTFNYLYIDDLDTMSHIYGVNSKQVSDVIHTVEEGVRMLISEFDDLTIILTADHGQVEMKDAIYLNKNTDYTNYFYAMPSIDTRAISFFVKKEYLIEFKEKFLSEFSEDVILLEKEKVKEYRLFGKEEYSKQAYDSLGEYVAIIVNDKFMLCEKEDYEEKCETKGNHSGLTPYETTIPLVIL